MSAAEPRSGAVWSSRAGAVALAVLAAQALWRGLVLARGYFTQDDFLVMAGIQDDGLWGALGNDYAGGFSPIGTALVWATTEVATLAWPLAAASVLTLQAGATAMAWVVLARLLPGRWVRLPLLVMFAFSPLTLWSTQWWVLGLEFWTSTLLLMTGVWALLVAVQDGIRRRAVLIVPTSAAALLVDDRALVHMVVLVGVGLLAHDGETVRARVAGVIGGLAGVWAGTAAVLVGYLVLRWQAAPWDLVVRDELGDVVTGYLRQSVAEVFGGPWIGSLPAHAYLVPTSWVVAANGALLLAAAGATLQRGGLGTRLSWALLVVVTAASTGLLALAGRGELVGSLGLVHRYAAELAPVVMLCLAGAVREVEIGPFTLGGRSWSAARSEGVSSVVATLALVVSAAVSTALLAPNLYHRDDRRYVENLRAALRADPQAVLLDGGVPAGVISPWYGDRARVSTVIGHAPENPVFDLPSHRLRLVRDDGTLAAVAARGAITAQPSDDAACPYPVRTRPVTVPFQGLVPAGRWVLRIGYYTNTPGFATVEVAGRTERFAVREGLQVVQLVVEGSFDEVRIAIAQDGATLCVTDASAGIPVAEEP